MSSRLDTAPPRPAADLIEAVLENMRSNLEPLRYSTLAPSRFLVYLHPDEFARVERIVPLLQEQTARALGETLEQLNHRPAYRRYWERISGSRPPIENPTREWQIEFLPDADGELAPGDVLVLSELLLPGRDHEPGVGQRTRRIMTGHVGSSTTRREEMRSAPDGAAPAVVHARLRYEDKSGPHTFEITRDSITIGRGGIAYHADVKIDASVDVSREHARIRRDPSTARFFLIDLSTLGTTLNGQRVARGYDEADGAKRENGVEVPLLDDARIGLADTVFLQFEVDRRK